MMRGEWIFHLCRNALRLPLGIFVKKIHFDGTENFSKGMPVLLACNHPNSFLDGVVFGHFTRRRVFILARGDAFKKPVVNYILRGMRLLPIFRARDADADTARKGNSRTMDELYERFSQKDSVLIFSEGIAYPEKAVRPVKNGTAGIAVEMAKRSDFTMDLHVVPASLNYSKFWTLMQTVHVTYHKPIPVLEYKEMIMNDEKGFTNMLMSKVKKSFDSNVVVTKGEYSDEKEMVHTIMLNENYKPLTYRIMDSWELSIEKANKMGAELAEKVANYEKALKTHNVYDSNVGDKSFDFLSAIIAISTLFFSLPVYLVWLFFWKLADRYAKRKFKSVVFWDSVRAGIGMFHAIIIIVTLAILTANFYPSYWWILFTTAGIYGGICWYRFIDSFPHLWKELTYLGLSDEVKADLTTQREEIIQRLK